MLKSTVETLSAAFDSTIEKIVASKHNHGMLSEEAEQLTNGVLAPVEDVCKLVLKSLAFKITVETSPNVSLWHTIRFRRNVCFCQGVRLYNFVLKTIGTSTLKIMLKLSVL
jgi:hypothetical protein